MGAHPNAFERLADRLRRTKVPFVRDQLLDQWLDFRDRATEWDAKQWGFNPDKWMSKERAEMKKRAEHSLFSRESAANT